MTDLPEGTVETEVLVVGGGGAASMAAVHASRQGARTTLVCKGQLGRSGATPLAGAGIQMDGKSACEMGFPGDPKWTKEKLFREIVIEGFYLNNQRLVEVWAEEAAARLGELLDWGLKAEFRRPGNLSMPGLELARACAEGVKRNDIAVVEDVMVVDILLRGGKVAGALAVDVKTGEFIVFEARAVVLCTGGWHQAYPFTSGSRGLTGDGQAMAYRAGAELLDMEMVTFCPNTILWPKIHRGSIFGYVASFDVDAKMLDDRGRDIMADYDPEIVEIAAETEFNKNIWSIASARAVAAGRGSPHGGVYWSMKDLPLSVFDEILSRRYPNWRWQGEDFSDLIDLLKKGGAVEAAPAAHYFEGGIAVNERCETRVPGLYAAGECGGGVFGANRVCDATTEMVVFGGVAGKAAAEYVKKADALEIDPNQVNAVQREMLEPFDRGQGLRPTEVRKRIQAIAGECVGIVRDGVSLERAVREGERIRVEDLPRLTVTSRDRAYNKEWVESLEVKNLLLCVEASAKAALMRTESRGLHYRTDCLMMDNDAWLKEIVVKQVEGRMTLTTRPITVTKMKPPKGRMTWEEYIVKTVPALKGLTE